MSKTNYINITQARPNISKMVDHVSETATTYVIEVRNKPKAVLIDMATATEYLPKKVLKTTKQRDRTSSERFYYGMQKILKNPPKFKGKDAKNLSENIDKIVYGI